MAQSQLPHFDVHMREMYAARRRFRLVAGVLVLAAVGLGFIALRTPANTASFPIPNRVATYHLGPRLAARSALTTASPAAAPPASHPSVLGVQADKTPPSVPENFQATVSDSSALVSLVWTASTDASGIKSYELDRTTDQIVWDKLADDIVDPHYDDMTGHYGVHYFYRLSALDSQGNASGYTTADVAIGEFNANTSGATSSTYASDDKLAAVVVPNDAFDVAADCSVSSISGVAASGKKPGTALSPLIFGPYTLVCKTLAGDLIPEFRKPVTWSFLIKQNTKGYTNPLPYHFDNEARGTLIKGSTYNESSGIMKFNTTNGDPAGVEATLVGGLNPNVIFTMVILGAIITAVFVVILRKSQKSKYDDYLRSKYYNT